MTCNPLLIAASVCGLFVFFYLLGQAILVRYMKDYRAYFAPVVGYAAYAYVLFGMFHITTHPAAVWGVTLLLGGVGLYSCFKHKSYPPRTYKVALLSGLGIALYVAYIMWIKSEDGQFFFLAPTYDHIKTAITSSIVNTGLPVINPFCTVPARLSYYFLYYVPSAAQVLALGMSSYEAEIASAMLATLLGSLAIFGTLTVVRQKECDWKNIVICTLLMTTGMIHVWAPFLTAAHGFDSILTTLVWTPQTFLSVACLLVVVVLIHQYRMKPTVLLAFLLAIILGLSVYIAIVAVAGLGLFFIVDMLTSSSKKQTVLQWLGVGVLSLAFALLFIANQAGINSGRFPIAMFIYPWTLWKNLIWQIVGFWTIYCFIQMPMLVLLNAWKLRRDIFKQYSVFYLMIFISIFITCFFKTVIDNNDLGWRAILVAIVLLTVFAAHWFFYIKSKFVRVCLIILAVICINTPFNKLNDYAMRPLNLVRPLSAQSLAAIRQHISIHDAFLNNIWEGKDSSFWNANVDVIIFSQRNSCYANLGAIKAYCHWQLRPFVSLVDAIYWQKEVPVRAVSTARQIGCTKFLFHYLDPNFDNEAALEAAGLRKIYQNDQIKIYE